MIKSRVYRFWDSVYSVFCQWQFRLSGCSSTPARLSIPSPCSESAGRQSEHRTRLPVVEMVRDGRGSGDEVLMRINDGRTVSGCWDDAPCFTPSLSTLFTAAVRSRRRLRLLLFSASPPSRQYIHSNPLQLRPVDLSANGRSTKDGWGVHRHRPCADSSATSGQIRLSSNTKVK